ncbi:hypothetical protein D3C72_2432910 [compost metagenome]
MGPPFIGIGLPLQNRAINIGGLVQNPADDGPGRRPGNIPDIDSTVPAYGRIVCEVIRVRGARLADAEIIK